MTAVTVAMRDGIAQEMAVSTFEELRAQVRGQLLLRGDSGYDAARTIWNGMIDRKPAAILRCVGTMDIIAGVNFAREHGITLCLKGGGHNISGLAVVDDALMLDMSQMRGVWVDPSAHMAVAQPGCTLGDVDRETQLHGQAAVLGFVSNTGIAGLTLGGGFGYLTRKYGWTSDNVLGMDVVTAAGQLIRVSEAENPDLFWALRGGGGNFGVVTRIDYRTYDVGPDIMAGAIAWRAEDAPQVLDLFKSVAESAPPELTCTLVLRSVPPAPWLPPEQYGKPMVAMLVCHAGSITEGEKVVAQLKSFGKPIGDVIQRRPYITQQALLDATQPNGRRYYWKSEYLPGLDAGLFAELVKYWETMPSPHSALIIFPIDGAIRNLPDDHSAVGNRNAKMVLNITGSWESPAHDDVNIAWTRDAWKATRRFSTGGTYVNFLTEEEGAARIRDAYGANFDRLVDVKTKYDPTNLFAANKNIPPRAK